MTHAPGDPIRIEVTKWGDRPHWVYPGVYLGNDQHGDWIGFPDGTRFTRPGAEYVAPYAQVALIPHAELPERGWIAAFHSPEGRVQVYVDIATPPVWDGGVVRSVDLDLDVVRDASGRTWVDDEDEFAEHQVVYGYPADVIAAARASADELKVAVETGAAPYDGTHVRWLKELSQLIR